MSIPGLVTQLSDEDGTMSSTVPETAIALVTSVAPVALDAAPAIEAPESLDQATISIANEEVQVEAQAVSSPDTIDAALPPSIKGSKICCVCHEEPGRYKCPRCQLPYCSIPCLKHHKIDHPPDPPKPESEPEETPRPQVSNPQPGTVAAAGYKGPFACLDHSKELIALFAQFPDLPRQLEMIEAATHEPIASNGYGGSHNYHSGGGGANAKQGKWNQDKGWQDGIEALHKAKRVYGRDGEGVKEFVRLILMLLEKGERGTEIIEREVEDENARLIRQLLEQDTASYR